MSSKHCGPVIPNSSESSDTDEIELFSDPPRSAQVQVKATRTSSTKSNPTASRISKNVRDADSRSGVSGSSTQHNKAVISNRKPLGPSTAHNRGESANQSSKAVESALRASQLETESLRAEISNLKAQLEEKKKTNSRSKRHVAALKAQASKPELDKIKTIQISAKMFVPTVVPWVEESLFIRNQRENGADGESGSDTEEELDSEGFLLAYKNAFPPAYRKERFSTDNTAIWLQAMGSIRSTLFHRVRHECCHLIYGSALADEIANNRADSEALRKWIGGIVRNGTTEWDVLSPWILYPDDATAEQLRDEDWCMENLLRSNKLMRATKVMLFGPGSLSLERRAGGGNDVYGTMWGLSEITPNIIGFTAMMVIAAASPDPELVPIGKVTKINYLARAIRYTELAMEIQDLASGRETIAMWNRFVFDNVSRANPVGAREGGMDALEAMRRRIRAKAKLQQALSSRSMDESDEASEARPDEHSQDPKGDSPVEIAAEDTFEMQDDEETEEERDVEANHRIIQPPSPDPPAHDPPNSSHIAAPSSPANRPAPSAPSAKPLRRTDDSIIMPDFVLHRGQQVEAPSTSPDADTNRPALTRSDSRTSKGRKRGADAAELNALEYATDAPAADAGGDRKPRKRVKKRDVEPGAPESSSADARRSERLANGSKSVAENRTNRV